MSNPIMELNPELIVAILSHIEENPSVKSKLLRSIISNERVLGEAKCIYDRIVCYYESLPTSPLAKVRIYMASCIDITHSGHFNAMRQAKSLGDLLVFGVISDEEIRRCKGPPVMTFQERRTMAEACKWVDHVLDYGVEYYVTPEILERAGCDYAVHGDDLAIRKDTGTDAYEAVRRVGKLKIIKRTEGISTTELVGKMLLMTQNFSVAEDANMAVSAIVSSTDESSFVTTTRRIVQFSSGKRPLAEDKVVYVDGSFDLLHCGHVEFLKKARALGDFLLVGVHSDRTTNEHKGKNYPLMNLHERTLSSLALRYVDDVIMGAPWAVTGDMIRSMNIAIVAGGSNSKEAHDENPLGDPYRVPKEMGIFVKIPSDSDLNTEDIVERIVQNRLSYIQRNKILVEKEREYNANKQFVEEG